jgi:uncharacterized membrane-anchored protein YjiN (DUF445 family)
MTSLSQPLAQSATATLKDLRLTRIKRAATGLLILAAIMYVVAVMLVPRYPLMSYVAATCEAAMVGALADWFAVVALFRHPLNVPLPHTAIIPKNKARIAQGLGEFIQEQFLSTPALVARIREFDPALQLSKWLSVRANAHVLAGYLARAVSYGAEALDDNRVREFLHRTVVAKASNIDSASLLADILEVLTENRRHHALLDQVLAWVRELLGKEETRQFLRREIAAQMPMLKWVNQIVHLDDKAAVKLLDAAIRRLEEVLADPGHELRGRFDAVTARFIERLRTDPAHREKVAEVVGEIAQNPALGEYLAGLWAEMRAWLETDVARPDSAFKNKAADFFQGLGGRIASDRGISEWINDQVIAAVPPFIGEHRVSVGRFIERQINEWQDATLVRELERNIGPDLQYIRINGTLVGGAAGLIIYSVTRFLTNGNVG